MLQLPHPWDPNDPNFIQSFSVDQVGNNESLIFLNNFGFIVVKDILSGEECQKTIDEMFDYLETAHSGFERNNFATWSKWKYLSFGMCSKKPIFSKQIMMNRQNPNIYKVFSTLLENERILINHDRWAIYQPTLIVGKQYQTPDNLHLDINPWRFNKNDPTIWDHVDSMDYTDSRDFITENLFVTKSTRGRQFQAILNLKDNYQEDGGLVLVPGFHNYFDQWLNSIGPMTDPECRYKFKDFDPILKNAIRIPCRAGSMVIWDQRLAHGSKGNKSENMRCVQFMKCFCSDKIPQKRLKNRRNSLKKIIHENKFDKDVSDIGKIVFGL